jgi:hypothetical protein
MTKLDLATSDEHNRRVLAVVTYLKTRTPTALQPAKAMRYHTRQQETPHRFGNWL